MANDSDRPDSRRKWTRALQDRFLDRFVELGSVTGAIDALGLARSSVYRQRHADPVFAAAWARAEALSTSRLVDAELDAQHNGVRIVERDADGRETVRRAEPSQRQRSILLNIYARRYGLGADSAATAAAAADAAARRRISVSLVDFARGLGVLL